MSEFFYQANSNAAPIVSDSSSGFVQADSPEEALREAVARYDHPAGLYALAIFESADAFHKGERQLARWDSERAIKQSDKISREGHL